MKSYFGKILKIKNMKFTHLATTVNTVTGGKAGTDMWHKHFKDLLHSSKDVSVKIMLF